MPCPNTTQSATRSEDDSSPSKRRDSFSFSRTLREVGDAKMATASTLACSRRPTGDDIARPSRPPSNASAQLNATVRYPPPDALRLFALGEACDDLSPPSRDRSPCPAPRTQRLRRSPHHSWRCARRRPAL